MKIEKVLSLRKVGGLPVPGSGDKANNAPKLGHCIYWSFNFWTVSKFGPLLFWLVGAREEKLQRSRNGFLCFGLSASLLGPENGR